MEGIDDRARDGKLWRGCSDKVSEKTDGHQIEVFSYLKLYSLSSITTMERLSAHVNGMLEGSGLFERYFIHLIDDFGSFTKLCDSRSAHSLVTDFADLLPAVKEFWSVQNAGLNEMVPFKLFNVTDAAAKGRVEPWTFFLHRLGVKEIVAQLLDFGGTCIGVFWYVPRRGDHKIPASIPVLLSSCIASFQQFQQRQLSQPLPDDTPFSDRRKEPVPVEPPGKVMIGTGQGMKKLNLLMDKVAPSYATVLILGETGTGKELVANEIHFRSDRKDKPFIKVNCAALPLNLIESELFGHEKGSFTGAMDKRIGKFELADGGTLFLDEIGEMDLPLQVKLLRVLQEKEIERLGSSKPIRVNVRIIAATSRDLQSEVVHGRFRSDLYYRLNVFSIPVPPLRDRMEDLPILCRYFLDKYAPGTAPMTLSKHAVKQITEYHWPGNVRELEHFIERSILVNTGLVLKALYLPEKQERSRVPGIETHFKTIEEMERDHLKDALRLSLGRISGKNGAAALLGLPPSTLSSKLARLNIDKEEFSGL